MDDLRLLRVLREVALRGSFSAAAEALCYTQPAVSQQVARLERQVGAKLLERRAGELVATPAGSAVIRYAERVLAERAQADAELHELLHEGGRTLKLGAYPSAAGTIVPAAVSTFRQDGAGAPAPELLIAEPPALLTALREEEADVIVWDDGGFCGSLGVQGLVVDMLLDDPLHVALPRDHPLAVQPSVRLEQLRDERWLLVAMPGVGDGWSNVILRACREAGFEPRVVFSSIEYVVLCGLVAGGGGVALLPGMALASLRADIAIRPLEGEPPKRRVFAVARDRWAHPEVARMIACLQAAARGVAARVASPGALQA